MARRQTILNLIYPLLVRLDRLTEEVVPGLLHLTVASHLIGCAASFLAQLGHLPFSDLLVVCQAHVVDDVQRWLLSWPHDWRHLGLRPC